MIEDISKKISWLREHPKLLTGIFRGIERETLRIKKNGDFSQTKHPYFLGSPLTHQWITTDFSENLLEFITPASNKIDDLLSFLTDIHCFTASNINDERMWPFSIPYSYNKNNNIQIAQYGNSNLGKMKSVYRTGLKNRYGDLINTISGVHYNFSLPLCFWKYWKTTEQKKNSFDYVSKGYLHLIRNYYRFGWIIPYLFGASPAIPSDFLNNSNTNIKYQFKKNKENIFYLPWSTSLRISNIGYTQTKILDLNIMFNNFDEYLTSLQKALDTPSRKFINIGLKDKKNNFQQLNTNFLQTENELYTQIRPKRNIKNGETPIEALKKRGIEYIEIRSLDINPFSPIGIDKNQILLLDLFLIWCALIDSPKTNKKDFILINKNWEKIIFEGRKPNQKMYIYNQNKTKKLIEISEIIFKDLKKIALILDKHSKNLEYQIVCEKMRLFFFNPQLTYSARILQLLIKEGIKKTGLYLSQKYYKKFINHNISNINKKILQQEVEYSHQKQTQIEKSDTLSFEEYIKNK
ncbi:glutamate--cysteine ligase [Buchnera aphidicola (Macrosiphoniella sanborni)]|uniref:Glutamate--cysteine ligase n=1 Tax=Buchnera aphidicola (Macrosiphoniella sanborni) TaxID=1241865 RepID=A0A4D6YED3_9GAMM|nr:glutamate--cysteine ligase [Buchnera aphidicola]QCI23930.1 glutamate--cysteine ligase [Buchnera aphidicola (Macrosiphoniella sanborni)]